MAFGEGKWVDKRGEAAVGLEASSCLQKIRVLLSLSFVREFSQLIKFVYLMAKECKICLKEADCGLWYQQSSI